MAIRNTTLAIAAALGTLWAYSAIAQTAGQDPHHPATPATAGAAAAHGSQPAAGPAMPMGMMCQGMMAQGGMGQGMMGQGGIGQGMMGQGMMGQGMMGQGMMGRMADMASRVEGRIAFLKAELKITESQQALWNSLAEALRTSAKSMAHHPGGMTGERDGTLAQKLAARDKSLTERLDALRRYRAAVEPLYAALNDEQKKAADELLTGPMGIVGMGAM